jgi:histidine triad (HIT) family protein
MSDCLFCKIVEGSIPSTKVYEDDEVLAFRDIDPKAPTHVLVIPKRHIASLNDAADGDAALMGKIVLVSRRLAAAEGIDAAGYRLVNNCGDDGGQAVHHIHFHLLGGRRMTWPPG